MKVGGNVTKVAAIFFFFRCRQNISVEFITAV